MASSDGEAPRPSQRPGLVDELERMGFRPVDADVLQAGVPLGGSRAEQAAASRDAPVEDLSREPSPEGVAAAADPSRAPAGPTAAPGAAAPTPPAPAASAVTPEPTVAAPPVDRPRPDGAGGSAGWTPAATAPQPGSPALGSGTAAASDASAAGPQAPTVAAGPGAGAAGPEALTADSVLRARSSPPPHGWRRALYAGTFGLVDVGPGAAELHRRELVARATRPVPGCWRVAVVSLKGGVGKTTTTAALGVQMATLRGDRVVAVDANPDRGTLGEKVPQTNPATVRDLLRDRERLVRYSDVRAYTTMSPSRLEVLASDADPTASQAFSESDYRSTISVLEHFYSVILTDCGTGLLHSAMGGVLGLADALVLVTSPSLDGARSASATLDWLEAHGRAGLVTSAVVVVSSVRPRGGRVDVDVVARHFAARCRAVVQVPFDPHLEAGATVELSDLRPATRRAYLELAASLVDGLP